MGSRVLLVYYSLTGRTAKTAKLIARTYGLDTDEIKPVDSYPNDPFELSKLLCDGELDPRPKITPFEHDIRRYGTVVLGMPVWNNGLPPPVMTFLESTDWRGVKIHPFFSTGGIYIGVYSKLKEACKGAGITDPLYITYDSNGEILRIKELR